MPTQALELQRDPIALDQQSSRYQLHVIGSGTGEVVEHIGGWLFDRALAGWEISVLLPGREDPRPLHILGVRVVDLEPVNHRGTPQIVAVSSAHGYADFLARHESTRAAHRDRPEVVVWGPDQRRFPRQIRPSEHRLSIAARGFKRHAMAAAGAPVTAVDPVEMISYGSPAF